MKRVLLGVLGFVLLLLLVAGGALMWSFRGLNPVTDGAALGDGVTLVRDGFVNAFVVPSGDGAAVLIDCGQDPDAKALQAALARQHRRVVAIFLTHGHGDHMGGCRAFPNAEVYAFDAERALIEGTAPARGPLTQFTPGDPAKSPKVTRSLTDGATVVVGDAHVRAFLLPGHTQGSAAFLAKGVLFLGDALNSQTDGQLRLAPWVFSDDLTTCRQSVVSLARRLAEEHASVSTLAFAHSGPLEGIAPLAAFVDENQSK